MTTVYLLTDYKNRFGLKWYATPYRGGFDHELLANALSKYDLEAVFIPCSQVGVGSGTWRGKYVLYTSSEEIGNNYKVFIEDTICGLEEAGAHLVPRAPFLRAHQNKVFMEYMRDSILGEELTGLRSRCFGTLEEFRSALRNDEISFPCVLKPALGAGSRGVALGTSAKDAMRMAKLLSRTPHRRLEIKDYVRSLRRELRGYRRESLNQGKFIVQPLVPGLDSDWKVLVYGCDYYVLKRHVRPGDFRASGSHQGYLSGRDAQIPEAALDMVQKVYEILDVPHLSADVAYDGVRSYLLEFQAVYFGNSTQAEFCKEYTINQGNGWEYHKKTMSEEEAYAAGVAHYIERHSNVG